MKKTTNSPLKALKKLVTALLVIITISNCSKSDQVGKLPPVIPTDTTKPVVQKPVLVVTATKDNLWMLDSSHAYIDYMAERADSMFLNGKKLPTFSGRISLNNLRKDSTLVFTAVNKGGTTSFIHTEGVFSQAQSSLSCYGNPVKMTENIWYVKYKPDSILQSAIDLMRKQFFPDGKAGVAPLFTPQNGAYVLYPKDGNDSISFGLVFNGVVEKWGIHCDPLYPRGFQISKEQLLDTTRWVNRLTYKESLY